MDLSKFKNIFFSEVEDQLQVLNNGMLALEKLQNKDNVNKTETIKIYNDMMRAAHTVKGSSASMGYVKMAFLTHVLEDVFDAAQNNRLELEAMIFNKIFKAIDNIEKSLKNIKKNDADLDFDKFSLELKDLTGVKTQGIGKSMRDQETDTGTYDESSTKSKVNSDKEDKIAKKENIDTQVSSFDDIEESAISKIDYIKVPVKRLDSLLDMVEELLISRMRIEEVDHDIPELKEIFSQIDLLISGIQFEVTQSRLVPVEQAFARFPRMIRDLSMKEGKDIDFEVSGGEIELDRSVVDKLGEPLIHLLRNAVDHGIEKSGQIKLQAVRKSERVTFIVENIGAQINVEKIKKVALEKGITDTKTISQLKEKDIINYIFHPNFSTKDKVTEISGRGVGLSVVKNFAKSFNGRVIVEKADTGSRFLLELPQTLAIIESLLVKVGASIFAIPFTDIDRSIKLHKSDIKKMADRDMGVIDNRNIPLIDLNKSLHMKSQDEEKENESHLVVLVKKEEGMAGIVVDSLVSEQEVIVKPLSSVLRNIKEFSGSTILGDGKVVLILDVLNIIKSLNKINN